MSVIKLTEHKYRVSQRRKIHFNQANMMEPLQRKGSQKPDETLGSRNIQCSAKILILKDAHWFCPFQMILSDHLTQRKDSYKIHI